MTPPGGFTLPTRPARPGANLVIDEMCVWPPPGMTVEELRRRVLAIAAAQRPATDRREVEG